MMKQLLTIILFTVLANCAASASTATGVEFALAVHQLNEQGQPVLLYTDTCLILESLPATGFAAAFSIELDVLQIDSGSCSFQVHAVTLGPPAYNYSKHYRVEYSLPARLDGIIGKGGAEYLLTMIPMNFQTVDTSACHVSHRDDGAFTASPSAYMDFYYAPNSFGDFYYNYVKGIFEDRYRLFKAINNFNLPGKYLIYLAPCAMYSVIWDKRFGMMIDPTRNTAFGIYTKRLNGADPFLVLQASVYRNYGYAPPFIAEGLAEYLSFPEYGMKKLVADHSLVPLDSLLDTYAYLKTEPNLADRTAASFAKFLIDQYQADKFLTMYAKVDDLNLRQVMTDIYGKSVSELQQEWLYWIDTVQLSRQDLTQQSDLAEASFNFKAMRDYNLELLKIAINSEDSLGSYRGLVQACFNLGNYYEATDYQLALVGLQPDYVYNWIALGGYQMMNGLYKESREAVLKARERDSTDQLVDFNLALNALHAGDTTVAHLLMRSIILNTAAGGPQAETRALYGNILAQSESAEDKARAVQYCGEAVNMLSQAVRSGSADPTAYLWSGIAYLGIGDTGNAWDFLQIALFIETRPFYEGMASLWLGKVADLMGEHQTAVNYYGLVISGASADYHQKEARRLIDEPYQH